MKLQHTLGLATAVALALPAVAGAHGTVYSQTARVVGDPAQPTVLTDQTRYVVSNHGFTYALRESNGATDAGMVNYGRVPSGYRNQAGLTSAARFARIEEGDTGAQPHATCRGVAALETQAAIEAWQASAENPSTVDPFYLYVPFQATSAGLEDDPARWRPVLADAGVTADELATPAAAQSACTALGGTYTAADAVQTTAAALAAGTIEAEVTPLQTQITLLTGNAAKLTTDLNAAVAARAAADAAKAAADRAAAQANADLARLRARDVTFTLAQRANTGGRIVTMVTGPVGAKVTLRATVSAADQRRLGLRTRTFVSGSRTLGAAGASLISLVPARSARAALAKQARATAVTLTATSGDVTKTAKATLK